MTTEMTIKDAIARSISHDEIVQVVIEASHICEALARIWELATEYDYAREDDGSYDVWGETEDGLEFRLSVIVECRQSAAR